MILILAQQGRLFLRPKGPICAFSLLEVTISTLLVSLVLVSSLQMVGSSMLNWQAVEAEVDAQALAKELMAEILATSYEDSLAAVPEFGIESSETASPANRLEFDDTDDYKSWAESPPTNRDGTAMSNYSGWERIAAINKLNADDLTQTIADNQPDQGVRRVQVTVSDPSGEELVLYSIVSNHGAVEVATGVDTEFVTAVQVELTAGTSETIVQQTDLINHADGP